MNKLAQTGRYILGIILMLLTILPLASADEFEFTNEAFKKTTARHKSKRTTEDSRQCYVYVEVDGNHDWRKFKDELNTMVDNSQCRTLTVYKLIKSVSVRERKPNNDSEFDYNLGVIVRDLNKLRKIDVTTIVRNSRLRTGKSNLGVYLEDGKTRNMDIKTDVRIKDSSIGGDSDFFDW